MPSLGDLSPQGSIAVGIIVGLLSTSIQSLGLTLQRKSHLLEDGKRDEEVRRPAYKRRRWQLGMSMFILSNIIGSTIQITTLPLPVLSTLQASGLVFNTAFATVLLHEPFTRYSLIGTFLTCAGAALIAVFGAIGEPAHNLGQLLELLGRRQFVIWMVMTFLVVIGTVILARFLKYLSQSPKHNIAQNGKLERSPTSHRKTSSSSSRTSKPRLRTLSIPVPQNLHTITPRTFRLRMLRGLSYGLISGILSAHSLLVAKSAVELLVRTVVDHHNQFNRYQSWLILLALVALALSQLYYMHTGLRLCSTSVLYPFVFCIYNIIAILDGLIYFHQTDRLTPLHAGLIALGTAILLSGVVSLSWRLDETPPDEVPPAAAPVGPRTPLTPGLGLMPPSSSSLGEDSDDDSPSEFSARKPLLPTHRRRFTTNLSNLTTPSTERTPLLFDHRRRSVHDSASASTAGRIKRPQTVIGTPARDIWRDLEDSPGGDDIDNQDYLASLPRGASPWLSRRSLDEERGEERRKRRSSVNENGADLKVKKSRGASGRRRKIKMVENGDGTNGYTESRRSSAPSLLVNGEDFDDGIGEQSHRRDSTSTIGTDLEGSQAGNRRENRTSSLPWGTNSHRWKGWWKKKDRPDGSDENG
ncbi:MAG: hypothetical protein Q9227_008033 [Pyrenula ochraceoflavens]